MLGLFNIKHIDDPTLFTLAVNPKEYIEVSESENIIKKHKGLKKGAKSMLFEGYAKRINSLADIQSFRQLKKEKQPQHRFSIKHNLMVLEKVQKLKFALIKDKRYYFSDGVISLPFSQPYLCNVIEYKDNKKEKAEK